MTVVIGDCVGAMRELDECSVDSIVTDPPYGLKFMGKAFDTLGDGQAQQKWHEAWAREALRVLKPGGHLVAFGGSRTYNRLVCALEDVGFEIRDQLSWLSLSSISVNVFLATALENLLSMFCIELRESSSHRSLFRTGFF